MKTQKHTPGPWEIFGSSTLNITGKAMAKGRKVCSINATQDEDRANAALIAAAPEMLEALERVFRDLPANYDGPMMEQVESAIKKAKGL